MNKELFEEFLKAYKQICNDLDTIPNEKEIKKWNTPKVGLDYIANSKKGEKNFSFHLKTTLAGPDFKNFKMSATLEIDYSEGADSFFKHEDITSLQKSDNFLQKWSAEKIQEFEKHKEDILESAFNDADIRVYGIPGIPQFTSREFNMFLLAFEKIKPEKITIYEFRHVRDDDLYRQFSYAVLFPKGYPPLWAFFLEVGSPDSGGAKKFLENAQKQIEELKQISKLNIKRINITLEELTNYLIKQSASFEKNYLDEIYGNSVLGQLYLSEDLMNREVIKKFDEMKNAYKNKNYATALPILRIIIQEYLEQVYQKKIGNISEFAKKTIMPIVEELISKEILDKKLSLLFTILVQDPNEASHRVHPKEGDLSEFDEKRIQLTFQIGGLLLGKLEDVLDDRSEDDDL